MNCPRCNTPLATGARFCGVCGSIMPPHGSLAAAQIASGDENATLFDSLQNIPEGPGQVAPAGMRQTASSTLPDMPAASNEPARQHIGSAQAQAGTFQSVPQPTQPAPNWSPPQPTQKALGPQTLQQQGIVGSQPVQPQSVPAWPAANQGAYPQGVAPNTMNRNGSFGRPRRRGRALWSLLITLIVLIAILGGAWFLGVRPYIHDLAQKQLDQAFDEVKTQVSILQLALPPGKQTIHVSEDTINDYLKAHQTSDIQNLHMTVTPDGLQLDLQAYGFSSTILAIPIASNDKLQVENVRVQGVLGLVMSNDELTPVLNSNLQDLSDQAHRKVQKVVLQAHQMDIQVG